MKKSKGKGMLAVGGLVAAAGIAVSIYIGSLSEICQVTTYSMGSYVQQSIYGKGKEEAAQTAANAVDQLEDDISWKIEGSDIQRLNQNAGKGFIKIEENSYQILKLAADVFETGGAFDITIAPVSRLWDFDAEKHTVPDGELISSMLPNVDGNALKLGDNSTAALNSAVNAVELGAVGKGAACDTAAAVYKNSDVSAAIISVGGSVGLYGSKLFGSPWEVLIRDPDSGAGGMGTLFLKGGFVSTSGNYEKAFEQDGVLYHHILDPATGYPADSGLKSVTVWTASSGALSDALSTACFVMGEEDSRELLKLYGAEAVFITSENKVIVTEGLEGKFELTGELFELKIEN